jgi:hypothetical protein
MQDKTVYLNEVARECLAELDALDIHYGKIQAFTVNTRSLRRWGAVQISKWQLYYQYL